MGWTLIQIRHLFTGLFNESASDQGQWWTYYIDHQDEIQLDVCCELFIPLHQLHENEVSVDREHMKVYSLNTNSYPFVVHGNGDGKLLYKKIYNELFKSKSAKRFALPIDATIVSPQ